ncbi:hypothetical protein E2C01_093797 [Portunus trituberculatus]|uniref:Uncharacterized protein n=1 Tax=Portunus trituberculatus TaxID=210409 RepID=A0A5B7JVT4_PORTR|nr:hypothetical protein [Portunus trituberculatus]
MCVRRKASGFTWTLPGVVVLSSAQRSGIKSAEYTERTV